MEIINTCLPLDIIYESPRAEPKDKNINSGPVKLIWPKSWGKKGPKKSSHAISLHLLAFRLRCAYIEYESFHKT